MLNSTILDVVVALIFVFLSISLAAGAAVEAVASLFKLRSTTLKAGVMDLLNDQNFNDLAAELYAHALISPRGPGLSGVPATAAAPAVTVRGTLAAPLADTARRRLTSNLTTNMPAYIEPKQFANAFADLLSLFPAAGQVPTVAELQQAVNTRVPASSHPQINQLLHGIILRTNGDLKLIKGELASWFDSAMDRLSGVYKRYTQVLTFIAALLISFVINADAVQIAQRVWAQPSLVADLKVGVTAQDIGDSKWLLAKSLPFGWSEGDIGYVRDLNGNTVPLTGSRLGLAVLGWLITALASLFGAPFWFDALQRVTRLKGAGPSPDEKANKTSAAA
jgi:hypothetical protein